MANLIRKIVRKILYLGLKSRGHYSYAAELLSNRLIDDFLTNRNVTLKQKLWAYKRGFLGSSVYLYGLNDSNFDKYLSDFQYSKLFPINGQYGKWIDDKLTLRYVLEPFSEYLPKYYYALDKGHVIKLMDCPIECASDILGVIGLLVSEGHLAVKMQAGESGVGFYKLSKENDTFLVNEKKMDFDALKSFLSSLDRYIVTEYITSHPSIHRIYNAAPNSLRVKLIRDKDENPDIVGAIIRFGTSKTGVIDNALAGGIFCKINLESGVISYPKSYMNRKIIDFQIHPDSGERIEGVIPFWFEMIDKLKEISNYLPYLKWLGFDIIITDSTFKIIEINSHQGIAITQIFFPMRENNLLNNYFDSLVKKSG